MDDWGQGYDDGFLEGQQLGYEEGYRAGWDAALAWSQMGIAPKD